MSEDKKVYEVIKTVALSFSADAILLRSPLKFLEDAIEQKRFLEGVIVSVMYFERICLDKLKGYFEEKKVPL